MRQERAVELDRVGMRLGVAVIAIASVLGATLLALGARAVGDRGGRADVGAGCPDDATGTAGAWRIDRP